MKKNILIISNDRLFKIKNIISSDYNDTLNIIDGLGLKNKIGIAFRDSKKICNFIIQNKKFSSYLRLKLINYHKFVDYKIFMISITPFNFFIFLFLRIFNKKIQGYVYLRSDGHKEYYSKYGFFGHYIYELMFRVVISSLKIITVSKKISQIKKKKSILINPSELNQEWFSNIKKSNINCSNIKLLYLGRFKKEKGIFSLIDMISKMQNVTLQVVGLKRLINSNSRNIKYFIEKSSQSKIISLYDKCDIFILPSYTEGAPKVILESLARLRPIIIFDEIKHVKKNFKGIFVCKRNIKSLKSKISYISNNYDRIFHYLKNNDLPTKNNFHYQLNRIVK